MPERLLGLGGRKLAVTVLLVRTNAYTGELEVYIQERVSSMPTYPNTTVFPGGGVDPRDFEEPAGNGHRTYTGPTVEEWETKLGLPGKQVRGVLFGAGRELFEETGTLLATHADGSIIKDVSQYHDDRLALESHRLSLTQVLAKHGMMLRGDLLHPFAHWVTGDNDTNRFDAFSFVATQPEGQEPDGNTREAASTGWFSPRLILDGWRAGLLRLVIPTWAQLWELSQFDTVDQLLDNIHRANMTPIIGDPTDNPNYKEFFETNPKLRF